MYKHVLHVYNSFFNWRLKMAILIKNYKCIQSNPYGAKTPAVLEIRLIFW